MPLISRQESIKYKESKLKDYYQMIHGNTIQTTEVKERVKKESRRSLKKKIRSRKRTLKKKLEY